jgi:type 1 glutamine amidotransferase
MNKRALIVYGGWDGHTPRECAELFGGFLQREGFAVELADTLDRFTDRDMMMSLSLVVPIWTMGTITKEQEAGLLEAARSGVGVAGFHGGMIDAFRNATEYQWMTGGQFVCHPGGCINGYKVRVTDPNHEITRDVGDFFLPNTEQYYMHVDPGNHVLATTTFSGEHGDTNLYRHGLEMPYAWVRRYGKGRVFVAAWGHTYEDFNVPEAKRIVERGMLWASQ